MARKRSRGAWMDRHLADAYVRRAQRDGYRSRAAYKLEEIDARERLLGRGARVVDLGAAPGGWSQVAARRVGPGGRVVAVDRLAMDPIPGVDLVAGDFGLPEVLAAVEARLDGRGADLVLSDMAPNLTGIGSTDAARAFALAELALDFARNRLEPGGALLVKVFHGGGFEAFRAEMRAAFGRVVVRKPGASRQSSAELYLLGTRFSL